MSTTLFHPTSGPTRGSDEPASAMAPGSPISSASSADSGRLARLTGVQILATGSYAPPLVIHNEDLAHLGCDVDWIVQRTGILERRRAADDVAASDLAAAAAKRCLAAAGVAPRDVDLIVVATMSPDSAAPPTACRVQALLGATAPAFDLNAACSGFMYALVTGMQFVKTQCAHRVLVIGAEIMSRVANPADLKTMPLFGDGAGAILLGPGSGQQGLLSYTLGADGTGAELLAIPGGGSREPLTAEGLKAGRQYLTMDGRAVFKWAVRMLSDAMHSVLAEAHLTPQDIDHVVLHQANRRIIDAAAEELRFDPARVVVNLERYGNTSAASIPLVLDELREAGKLKCGQKLLLCGFGAGLTWGAGVFQL